MKRLDNLKNEVSLGLYAVSKLRSVCDRLKRTSSLVNTGIEAFGNFCISHGRYKRGNCEKRKVWVLFLHTFVQDRWMCKFSKEWVR